MDTPLVLVGSLLLIYSIVMLIIYVVRERGGLFDPITVSWIGYIVFIAGGLLLAGLFLPYRKANEARDFAVLLTIITTITFSLGLYAGKGDYIRRLIPRPAPTLGKLQIYSIVILGTAVFAIGATFGGRLGPAWASVMLAINLGFLGAACLACVFGMLSFHRSYFTKILFGALFVLALWLLVEVSWSRRPSVALIIAALALFYRLKISWRTASVKALFLGTISVVSVIMLLFLTATRVTRFYGGRELPVFSADNAKAITGDITVNYHVFEYIVSQYPEPHGYHYGSTLASTFLFWIPRSVWTGKPMGTSDIVTGNWRGEMPFTGLAVAGGNVTPLPIGEIYMNFGLLGVMILPFVVGKLVRGINTYLHVEQHNTVAWLAWFIAIPDFASEWRGDLHAMTISPIIRIAVFLGMAWFAGKISGKYRGVPETESYYDMQDYPADEISDTEFTGVQEGETDSA